MSSGAGLPGPKSCLQRSGEKLLERGKAGREGGRKRAEGRKRGLTLRTRIISPPCAYVSSSAEWGQEKVTSRAD